MIRLFTALCKSVLEKSSDNAIFQEATDGFSYHDIQCPSPNCGAKGKLSPHGKYYRYLISPDGEFKPDMQTTGKVIESRISPIRFKCMSCGATHALLPDILIPYSPYSLRFMLTVLVAYFERSKTVTVAAVCAYYGIAVSTLYAWKYRLLEHKDLLLGMLASLKEPAHTFIRSLFASMQLSDQLSDFFHRYSFSFLQNRTEGFTLAGTGPRAGAGTLAACPRKGGTDAKLSTAATRCQPP